MSDSLSNTALSSTALDTLWSIGGGIAFLCLLSFAVAALLKLSARRFPYQQDKLITAVNKLLPQTQCAQCGHSGCLPYAEAIISGEPINRCPPGGDHTIAAVAQVMSLPLIPLDQEFGVEPSAHRVVIREADCIGCTLCIPACPVDTIIGAPQVMHTVIEQQCTGCDLCLEPCPVDCIDIIEIPAATLTLAKHLKAPVKSHSLGSTACIRCGACEPVCPKLLKPQELFWHQENDAQLKALDLDSCIECMLCDRACPSHLPLTRIFANAKFDQAEKAQQLADAEAAEARYEKHAARHQRNSITVKSRSSANDRAALLAKLKQNKAG